MSNILESNKNKFFKEFNAIYSDFEIISEYKGARNNITIKCIKCGKCAKVCPFEAITVENNVAYIDFNKCKLCTKCVAECPTGAIHKVNFPEKPAAPAAPAAKPAEAPKAAPAEAKPVENNVNQEK